MAEETKPDVQNTPEPKTDPQPKTYSEAEYNALKSQLDSLKQSAKDNEDFKEKFEQSEQARKDFEHKTKVSAFVKSLGLKDDIYEKYVENLILEKGLKFENDKLIGGDDIVKGERIVYHVGMTAGAETVFHNFHLIGAARTYHRTSGNIKVDNAHIAVRVGAKCIFIVAEAVFDAAWCILFKLENFGNFGKGKYTLNGIDHTVGIGVKCAQVEITLYDSFSCDSLYFAVGYGYVKL